MELRRLRYFVAVAEELHFGRAAERLDMAQPPLSRQIAQLEAELEAMLFDRSRSQVRLTQAGEVLLERARDLLARVDSIEREVRLIGQGGAGRLRIAFVGSASYGLLPTLIKSFRSFYPKVDLALSAMNNAELKRALIQREIDIAVARPSLDDEEIHSQPLQEEPLILAMPDAAAAVSRATIPLGELAGETFILYPRRPRPSFADHVLEVCRVNGFQPRETVLAQDYQTAISLVSVGVGIAIVPRSVSQGMRPGVAFRPFQGANPGTALTVNVRRDNQSRHVANFIEIVRKSVRRSALRPQEPPDRLPGGP